MNYLPEDVRAVVKFDIIERIVSIIDSTTYINTMRDLEDKIIEDNSPSLLSAFMGQLFPRNFADVARILRQFGKLNALDYYGEVVSI